MTRRGDAPEGGQSFKFANPNYPQEGISLPEMAPVPDGPSLEQRLAERHQRFHDEGKRCWDGCPMNTSPRPGVGFA